MWGPVIDPLQYHSFLFEIRPTMIPIARGTNITIIITANTGAIICSIAPKIGSNTARITQNSAIVNKDIIVFSSLLLNSFLLDSL